MSFIKNIWQPDLFHGANKKDNYFEGWFFKLVNRNKDSTFAIIPGIFISKDVKKHHAFIQILDARNHESYYIKYKASDFHFSKNKFEVTIGSNFFSNEIIEIDIMRKEIEINGKIRFEDIIPWPVKLFSPGIMGWYSFVPFMECNHGVVSLNHILKGSLSVNNELISFEKGKGYIEKDWGSSFPSSYVWLQANNFEDESVCITGSVAKIPWFGNWFRGFIFGLLINDNLYRFTTYNHSRLVSIKLNDNFVEIELANKNHILKLKAEKAQSTKLHAPYDNEMLQRVSESLDAKIEVLLINKSNKEILFEGIGTNAGLEINGNLSEIIDNKTA